MASAEHGASSNRLVRSMSSLPDWKLQSSTRQYRVYIAESRLASSLHPRCILVASADIRECGNPLTLQAS